MSSISSICGTERDDGAGIVTAVGMGGTGGGRWTIRGAVIERGFVMKS